MLKSTLNDWISSIENFVTLIKSSPESMFHDDDVLAQPTLDNWNQTVANLAKKCSLAFKNAHFANILKHLFLAAYAEAFIFCVSGILNNYYYLFKHFFQNAEATCLQNGSLQSLDKVCGSLR